VLLSNGVLLLLKDRKKDKESEAKKKKDIENEKEKEKVSEKDKVKENEKKDKENESEKEKKDKDEKKDKEKKDKDEKKDNEKEAKEKEELMSSVRELLSDVLPLIRFGSMTLRDCAEFVTSSEVLTADQLIEVFTYLTTRTSKISFPTEPRRTFLSSAYDFGSPVNFQDFEEKKDRRSERKPDMPASIKRSRARK